MCQQQAKGHSTVEGFFLKPSILQAPRKNHPLVKSEKYLQPSSSPNNSMERDNHPAKQLASYKLRNSYAFFGTIHIKTSATMLTALYLLALAVADFTIDTTSIDPSSVTYVLLGVMMILIFAFSSLVEFRCFLIDVCPGGRFLILGMGSAIFCVSHCYCILIVCLCWKYFRYLEKKADLEQTWRVETIDEELDENVLIHNVPINSNFIQC
uniref:PGG domain-containing protein n=1 Tax=Elaeophora elaphi TaxID=1147741 RepID=A0A0R3S685_9BILA